MKLRLRGRELTIGELCNSSRWNNHANAMCVIVGKVRANDWELVEHRRELPPHTMHNVRW
jgi:hypothetical protein